MFRERVNSTKFTSDAAEGIFHNQIRMAGESLWDKTFLSTVRALIAPRMAEGDHIAIKTLDGRIRGDSGYSALEILDRLGVPWTTPNLCCMCSFNNREEENAVLLDTIHEKLASESPGYVLEERVGNFFRRSFRVECFLNEELRTTLVFVDRMDLRKFHYIQAATFTFFPWYFERNKNVTPEEMRLLSSLDKADPGAYLAALDYFADQYDFRGATIRNLLSGFESRMTQQTLASVKQEYREEANRLNEYKDMISRTLQRIEAYGAQIIGLEQKIKESEGDSEIMDYFLGNKSIDLIGVSDNTIEFVVRAYLENFSADFAESALDDRRSGFFCRYSKGSEDGNKIEMLYREMFLADHPRVRARFCAAYRITVPGQVRARSGYSYGSEYDLYMPNPHIHQYGCMGGYEGICAQLMNDHEYLMAIEQTIASAGSLNFNDPSASYFFEDMKFNNTQRFLELPDGRVVSVKEAVDWLEEENARSGEVNA